MRRLNRVTKAFLILERISPISDVELSIMKNEKVMDQTILCKDAAGALVFEGLPVKTAVCLTALFMNSFMTERDAGVLRKIRGKMKGGCCL